MKLLVVTPEPIDAEIQPEPHDAQHRLDHFGIVEVEIGLVRIEAVPVVGLGNRVPGPVGALGVDEDDPGLRPALVVVAPDVPVGVGVGAVLA